MSWYWQPHWSQAEVLCYTQAYKKKRDAEADLACLQQIEGFSYGKVTKGYDQTWHVMACFKMGSVVEDCYPEACRVARVPAWMLDPNNPNLRPEEP